MPYIQHAQNMHDELCYRLGPDHKYSKVLLEIIKAADATKAMDIIDTVCRDSEIQKIFFPIFVDFECQEQYCRMRLCGYAAAPSKKLSAIYMFSNGISHE